MKEGRGITIFSLCLFFSCVLLVRQWLRLHLYNEVKFSENVTSPLALNNSLSLDDDETKKQKKGLLLLPL